MSHYVVPGCNRGWNFDHPAIVVFNQLVITPSSWNFGVIDKTHTINLEEFQCCLVNTLTRVPAVS
jgi:hypothetical protein